MIQLQDPDKPWCDKMLYLRKHHNVPIYRLLNFLSIYKKDYMAIERGEQLPDENFLHRIAQFYNVPIEYILRNDDL